VAADSYRGICGAGGRYLPGYPTSDISRQPLWASPRAPSAMRAKKAATPGHCDSLDAEVVPASMILMSSAGMGRPRSQSRLAGHFDEDSGARRALNRGGGSRFIPEGAGRGQGAAGLGFRVRALVAGRAGLASWLWLFSRLPGFGRAGGAGQGPGRRARPRCGAGGVLDAGCPRADHDRGGGRPTLAAVVLSIGLWRAPLPAVPAWQSCWLPSSLRVCPGLAGPGGMGRVRVSSGRGQSQLRARPGRPGGWPRRRAETCTAARSRWVAAHAAGRAARRRCPSRMA